MHTRPGTLVLVVGPSGAGKDSLIAGARQALADDRRFVFPRRIVTRDAVAELEDHDSIGRGEFERQRAAGRYALCWEAHGLGYGLPLSIDSDIALGTTVVCNVSRRVISDARKKYPECAVVLITAEIGLRAKRLAGRGRESAEDVAARLAREGVALPDGVEPLVIDNSGPLTAGVTSFVLALRQIADV
jgi:phosphonate metabolism protein PhnN/1,5-bisphosphokinase (PRPP-forming)